MHYEQRAKGEPTKQVRQSDEGNTGDKETRAVLTDDQATELAKIEFLGALYVDDKGRPCWPGENLESMLLSAAKKQRRGDDCKIGILIDGDWPLTYDGPKTAETLWENEGFRKVCMARNKGVPVLKCRPIFHAWQLGFVVSYDPEILDESVIHSWLDIAGSRVGLSDWRPKFGRFNVLEVKAE